MKAVVATFNQEKALVGAFSVIVQPVVEPMDRFAALLLTHRVHQGELEVDVALLQLVGVRLQPDPRLLVGLGGRVEGGVEQGVAQGGLADTRLS